MSGYIFFNHEHNVLICKTHQYTISPKFLPSHFLQEYDLEATVRQEIVSYASQFTAAEATQLTYSVGPVIPISYLNTITGYKCQYEHYDKILGTLQSMQKHCRLNHEWKAKDGDRWVETRAQTFFQGNDRRYFAVREPGILPVSNFTEQLLTNLLDNAKYQDDAHQQAINDVQDTTLLITKTLWLRYDRWDKEFEGQDMKELHTLTDLPKPTAIAESIVATTVGKVLHACWQGHHDCVNREWDLLPFWLSSVHRDKDETKPF